MKKQYHVLNGDALKKRFPTNINGEIIVARECLVDGNVEGESLEELFCTRARFISCNYDGYSEKDYFDITVSEFKKIAAIPNNAEVNLWFEDDLFCQVNLWFTVNLLIKSLHKNSVFLIRPNEHGLYGFGGLTNAALTASYKKRTLIKALDKIASLWKLYQNNDTNKLLEIAEELRENYPFILTAVKVHIERIPSDGKLGRPVESLIQIIKELKTKEFGPVFKEFCKRESIYGFGDLQVKRLFDKIIKAD